MNKYRVNQKVRVLDPNQGGVRHFGWIEDVTSDMFDGSRLYIVRTKDAVRTYKEESILPLRKNCKTSKTKKS